MSSITIGILGLGYVGLPLACAFAEKFKVIGFDPEKERIEGLKGGDDVRSDFSGEVLQRLLKNGLSFTNNSNDLAEANIFIIAVPTPIKENKEPDLSFLMEASEKVGFVLKQGDIVIYESTVYPGCTEEDCVPVLEKYSGLIYNKDFFCGYSPERINVGDKKHTLQNILKVTSGSTPECAEKVDALYKEIITAGTYKAPSIKVAEAAKVIENAQRDLNISFVNELALIFDKMNLDTNEVLDAAATKWNFMDFRAGLVGGHCIGVDPYYLTYKAEKLGYKPEVISSGRRVNEKMGAFVADKVSELLEERGKKTEGSKVLILGFTFKENCNDSRSTGVINLYNAFIGKRAAVEIYDPRADKAKVQKEYSLALLADISYSKKYDAVVLAVPHDDFKQINFLNLKSTGAVIYDIKGVLDASISDGRL
jgi:UDP-N-acetyl-D-galactosamine dehydrogenase